MLLGTGGITLKSQKNKKYHLDESAIRPYLSLDNVIQDVFNTTNEKLWGLNFREIFDIDLYHPDARIWEVTDKDGSHLAISFMIILLDQIKEVEHG